MAVSCLKCKNSQISENWGELKCKLPNHETNVYRFLKNSLRTCKDYQLDKEKVGIR